MEYLKITNTILFLTFLINTGLGLFVFFKKLPQRRISISFVILSWSLALWNISVLMIYLFQDPSWKLFWVRMSFVATSITPFSFLVFSLFFPREKWIISNKKLLLLSIPSFIFIFLSLTNMMVRSVQWDTLTTYYGPIHPFFGIFVFTNVTGGLFFLLKSYKNSIGLERLQIKYCFLGMFISSIPAITANFILPYMGTSKLSNLGPSSTIIMVSFITYAILKYRLMDINIVLKKGTTYILL
jgi:two-component system, NtrC family, sensor kinase